MIEILAAAMVSVYLFALASAVITSLVARIQLRRGAALRES
jgi:hypothetical protein